MSGGYVGLGLGSARECSKGRLVIACAFLQAVLTLEDSPLTHMPKRQRTEVRRHTRETCRTAFCQDAVPRGDGEVEGKCKLCGQCPESP